MIGGNRTSLIRGTIAKNLDLVTEGMGQDHRHPSNIFWTDLASNFGLKEVPVPLSGSDLSDHGQISDLFAKNGQIFVKKVRFHEFRLFLILRKHG